MILRSTLIMSAVLLAVQGCLPSLDTSSYHCENDDDCSGLGMICNTGTQTCVLPDVQNDVTVADTLDSGVDVEDDGRDRDSSEVVLDYGADLGSDTSADHGPEVIDRTDVLQEDDGSGGTGEFGESCNDSTECLSGPCIDTGSMGLGHVCTRSCDDDCPVGWACEVLLHDDASDKVCLPIFDHLCDPCRTDGDCASELSANKAFCKGAFADGRFCTVECIDIMHCPAGYSCDVDGDTVGGASWCQPDSGQCLCSASAIDKALSTDCSVTNQFGTCSGSMTCTMTGISGCSAVNPAKDTCNGIDDDCDGSIDEDGVCPTVSFYCDKDGDGYISNYITGACDTYHCVEVDCATVPGTDCDDSEYDVNPRAVEVCDNGLDDDCDGSHNAVDALGCVNFFGDRDKDGYADVSMQCLCYAADIYTVEDGGVSDFDCNDSQAAVNPGQQEICSNLIDDNCDGRKDEAQGCLGCIEYYFDSDSDGWGIANDHMCLDGPNGNYRATRSGDCADLIGTVNPGATESCNGIDDDCDGFKDEKDASGCRAFYMDVDGDGYGIGRNGQCLCAALGMYRAELPGDCCDKSADARPNQTAFFATANECTDFDYNCDLEAERQETRSGGGCEEWSVGGGCEQRPGWSGNLVPNCSKTGLFLSGGCGKSKIPVSCKEPEWEQRTQMCR